MQMQVGLTVYPDRHDLTAHHPSRREFFLRVVAQFARRNQSILHAPPYSLTSDQTCWFRECMTDYVAVSSPRVIKIRKIQALRA